MERAPLTITMQKLVSKMKAIRCDNQEPRLYSRREHHILTNLSPSPSSMSPTANHFGMLLLSILLSNLLGSTLLPMVLPMVLPMMLLPMFFSIFSDP